MRITKVFRLQNSSAEIVAQALKDVFRDLLSANDKALEKKDGEQQRTTVYSFGELEGEDEDSPISFKGLLSIGVDAVSNTLVVSSTASLMDTVGALVEELDEAAEVSSTVRVLKVDSSVDLQLIQERLNNALGGGAKADNKPDGQNQQPGQNGMPMEGQQTVE